MPLKTGRRLGILSICVGRHEAPLEPSESTVALSGRTTRGVIPIKDADVEKPTRRLAIGAVAAGASALVASAFCPAVALSEPRQRRDEMKGMKDDVLEPLIKQAKEASVKAYCPYSKFRVVPPSLPRAARSSRGATLRTPPTG